MKKIDFNQHIHKMPAGDVLQKGYTPTTGALDSNRPPQLSPQTPANPNPAKPK